jgi:hypothetical protein
VLPEKTAVWESMDEYDEVGLIAWFGRGKGFKVVQIDAVAEFAKSMSEAVWALLEVPEGTPSWEALATGLSKFENYGMISIEACSGNIPDNSKLIGA